MEMRRKGLCNHDQSGQIYLCLQVDIEQNRKNRKLALDEQKRRETEENKKNTAKTNKDGGKTKTHKSDKDKQA